MLGLDPHGLQAFDFDRACFRLGRWIEARQIEEIEVSEPPPKPRKKDEWIKVKKRRYDADDINRMMGLTIHHRDINAEALADDTFVDWLSGLELPPGDDEPTDDRSDVVDGGGATDPE